MCVEYIKSNGFYFQSNFIGSVEIEDKHTRQTRLHYFHFNFHLNIFFLVCTLYRGKYINIKK